MALPELGTGATIAFGTSTYSASVEEISWDGAYERSVIETTHLGTTTARTFKPGDLYDPGTLTVTYQFDPDSVSASAPFTGAVETVTITFPNSAAAGGNTTWAASMFVTGVSPNVPLEEKMMMTLTLKATGAITVTA